MGVGDNCTVMFSRSGVDAGWGLSYSRRIVLWGGGHAAHGVSCVGVGVGVI